jgi:hypothetical protein
MRVVMWCRIWRFTTVDARLRSQSARRMDMTNGRNCFDLDSIVMFFYCCSLGAPNATRKLWFLLFIYFPVSESYPAGITPSHPVSVISLPTRRTKQRHLQIYILHFWISSKGHSHWIDVLPKNSWLSWSYSLSTLAKFQRSEDRQGGGQPYHVVNEISFGSTP